MSIIPANWTANNSRSKLSTIQTRYHSTLAGLHRMNKTGAHVVNTSTFPITSSENKPTPLVFTTSIGSKNLSAKALSACILVKDPAKLLGMRHSRPKPKIAVLLLNLIVSSSKWLVNPAFQLEEFVSEAFKRYQLYISIHNLHLLSKLGRGPWPSTRRVIDSQSRLDMLIFCHNLKTGIWLDG